MVDKIRFKNCVDHISDELGVKRGTVRSALSILLAELENDILADWQVSVDGFGTINTYTKKSQVRTVRFHPHSNFLKLRKNRKEKQKLRKILTGNGV